MRAILKDHHRVAILLLDRGCADFSIYPKVRSREEGADEVINLALHHAKRVPSMAAVHERLVYLKRMAKCVIA